MLMIGPLVLLWFVASEIRTHRAQVQRFERAAIGYSLGVMLWFLSIGGIVAAVLFWPRVLGYQQTIPIGAPRDSTIAFVTPIFGADHAAMQQQSQQYGNVS
jgi:hypothetical protein